jgi:hypothetical protein
MLSARISCQTMSLIELDLCNSVVILLSTAVIQLTTIPQNSNCALEQLGIRALYSLIKNPLSSISIHSSGCQMKDIMALHRDQGFRQAKT